MDSPILQMRFGTGRANTPDSGGRKELNGVLEPTGFPAKVDSLSSDVLRCRQRLREVFLDHRLEHGLLLLLLGQVSHGCDTQPLCRSPESRAGFSKLLISLELVLFPAVI